MANESLGTKQKILAAAESEFLVRGYDGARMQAIADRAGINKAMLHYHFRSKDELFAHIFEEKAKLLFPKVEASLREQKDFIAFACTFVDIYLAHLLEHPYLPFYVVQVSAGKPELFARLVTDFPQRFLRAFEAAARAGQVRPHDPTQLLLSILGMVVMPFVGRHMVKHLFALDEKAFEDLMRRRAEELKRYVVLMLTPEPKRGKR